MLDVDIEISPTACAGGGHFDVVLTVPGGRTLQRRVHKKELREAPSREDIETTLWTLMRLEARRLTTGDHTECRSQLHGKRMRNRRGDQ